MKDRIFAAWKVLRGDWVAHAPVKPKPSLTVYDPTTFTTVGTTTSIVWDYS